MSHPTKNHKKFLIILGAGPQQEKLYILAKAEGHNIVGIDINEKLINEGIKQNPKRNILFSIWKH